MQTIPITVPKLNPISVDAVIEMVYATRWNTDVASEMEWQLDLRSLTFVDPYGMTCLWAVLRYLETVCANVCVYLPQEPAVQYYLERMGFLALLEQRRILCENRCAPPSVHDEASDVLLEVTPISSEAEVTRVIQRIQERIALILRSQIACTEEDVANLVTALSEACSNVYDHSDEVGVAAAQTYTSREGTRFVIISVADYGRGVRTSLAERYEDAPTWSHGTALDRALQKECSRKTGRGLGLYRITEIIRRYDGTLHIRSGDTRLYLRRQRQFFTSSPFPGTQLGITLALQP